jgi:hypothetical protein
MDTTSYTSQPVGGIAEPKKDRFWQDPFWLRHPIISGALGGLLWGGLMRVWMRFISTDPEFSLSGTGFILGAALLAGLGLGTAYSFSRKTARPWWRLLGLPVILLGGGAGSLMLPGVLLGGLAFGRRDWPKAVRIFLGTVAIGGTIALLGLGNEGLGPIRTAVAMVAFAVFHAIEMAATGIVLAPARIAKTAG